MEKELTILIPALNEEKTIGICVKKANKFLKENSINGEVLVADNGSNDNTVQIAKNLGSRVICVEEKGYGSALINGSKSAFGKYIIMVDADDSYNILEIMPIYKELKKGFHLVIGNRYKGKMEKGAMKFLHRYIGTPLISLIGNFKYKTNLGDYNCGLRGYKKELINNLNCKHLGMEFATEMIIKAKKANYCIKEIPINFYKDGRTKKSHLNTFKDGFRHLKILFKRL